MKGKASKNSKSGRASSSTKASASAKTTSASQKAIQSAVAERDPRTLLGQILVELGYVTVYQLDEALHAQRTERASKQTGRASELEQKPLGQIMLELGYCTPNQLIRAIQVQADYRKAAARLRDS